MLNPYFKQKKLYIQKNVFLKYKMKLSINYLIKCHQIKFKWNKCIANPTVPSSFSLVEVSFISAKLNHRHKINWKLMNVKRPSIASDANNIIKFHSICDGIIVSRFWFQNDYLVPEQSKIQFLNWKVKNRKPSKVFIFEIHKFICSLDALYLFIKATVLPILHNK